MWALYVDPAVMSAFGELRRRARAELLIRLLKLMRDIWKYHPCRLKSDRVTRLRFAGNENRFLVSMGDTWSAIYHVDPSCEAESGTVQILSLIPNPRDS